MQQDIEIKKIADRNMKLSEEKMKLEKKIKEIMGYSTLCSAERDRMAKSEYNEVKTSLTTKLEMLTSKINSSPRRSNKIIDYCHIAPTNVFSDSEKSVSEEDSLEKEKCLKIDPDEFEDKIDLLSKFSIGIESASKSTPIKPKPEVKLNKSNNESSNLTQDLKDIQKYLSIRNNDTFLNNSNVTDWDLSQSSINNNSNNNSHNTTKDSILQGKEDPEEDHFQLNNNSLYESQFLTNTDNYSTIKDQIKQIYNIMFSDTNGTDVPSCSGDQTNPNESNPKKQLQNILTVIEEQKSKDFIDVKTKPFKSFSSKIFRKIIGKTKKSGNDCNFTNELPTCSRDNVINKQKPFSDSRIQMFKHNRKSFGSLKSISTIIKDYDSKFPINTKSSKFYKNQVTDDLSNEIMSTNNKEFNELCSTDPLNVFKSLSEISVKFISNLIKKLVNINQTLKSNNGISYVDDDYTQSVTEYLNYLMSLDHVDFESEICQKHMIYDIIKELQEQTKSVMAVLIDSGNTTITKNSPNITNYSQQNYNDNTLDTNVEDHNTQWSLLGDFMVYLQENLTLYESNRQLKDQIESIHFDFNSKLTMSGKQIQKLEMKIEEMLKDRESTEMKHKEELENLHNIIDQLERRVEAEKKFIGEQQTEWEMERVQHSKEIDILNKSISKAKRNSSMSNDSSDDLNKSTNEVKFSRSYSLTKSKTSSIKVKTASSQTKSHALIILKSGIKLKDLESISELKYIFRDISKKQCLVFSLFTSIADIIIKISEKIKLGETIPKINELCEHEIDSVLARTDDFWKGFYSELTNFKDSFLLFVNESIDIRRKYDLIFEELEIHKTNDSVKKDRIQSLEDEVHSLIDYQKNFSKDYDVIQTMLEDKQKEIDRLSDNILTKDESKQLEIDKLLKEIKDCNNIINEREEDIYVLKEEKEHLDHDLRNLQKKLESEYDSHKDMYKDLEDELNETQMKCANLDGQIKLLKAKLGQTESALSHNLNKEADLNDRIKELTQLNEDLAMNLETVKDELNLSNLRLIEYKQQQIREREKLNHSLQETESLNVELRNKFKKETSIGICQTESLPNQDNSFSNYVAMQEKLIKVIDKLKKEYKSEKEQRHLLELKYREHSSQYQVLSDKILTLETITKAPVSQLSERNSAVEFTEMNDILNESLNSIESFDDFDPQTFQNPCLFTKINATVQTDLERDNFSFLKENINIVIGEGSISNVSEWMKQLLNEVETVLEKCIFGNDVSVEMRSKLEKFKGIVEEFYKTQLSTLMDKTVALESSITNERKTAKELKYKSDFLMTELQESENKLETLQNRLDQELSNKTKLSDSNYHLNQEIKSIKSELMEKNMNFKYDLDQERSKLLELSRQLKNETQTREKLETSLMIAEERVNMTEQTNTELIKKNRQMIDYQQKEVDNFNMEYAEIFKRCNSYKLQLETLQQNLQHQKDEYEKTKAELVETINSNSEYRNKMNDFIKVYQDRRQKLESEMNELHQMLQLSCRREVTMIKENETLRLKFHSLKTTNKGLENKNNELEHFIDDMQQKHEKDRYDWLKMINGNGNGNSIKDNDDGVLTQVNWLLRMLQLRIELLVLHYNPSENPHNLQSSSTASSNTVRPFSADMMISSRRNTNELFMLLQSIKSMQSMIGIYLKNHQQTKCSQYNPYPFKTKLDDEPVLRENNNNSRPKPTGSSDSIDTVSDSECNSNYDAHRKTVLTIEPLNQKLQYIQSNQIVALEKKLAVSHKCRDNLLLQKDYIMSRISTELRNDILTIQMTQSQKMYSRTNYYKFKFKVIVKMVLVVIRFCKFHNTDNLHSKIREKLNSISTKIPQPIFSTQDPITRNYLTKKPENMMSQTSTKTSEDSDYITLYPHSLQPTNPTRYSSDLNNISNFATNSLPRFSLPNYTVLTQTASATHNNNNNNNFESFVSRPNYFQSRYLPGSQFNRNNLLSNDSKSTTATTTTTNNNRFMRTKFSSTIQQLDDFEKRLDKYSDKSDGI